MEAKELRIGNIVADKDNDIFELSGFYLYQLSIEQNTKGIITSHKPIILTEEWLLKLGFEPIYDYYKIQIQKDDGGGNSDYFISVDTGMDNESNEFTIQLVSGEGDWFTSKNKYVHQLQNLYFALTGEELTIKIKE